MDFRVGSCRPCSKILYTIFFTISREVHSFHSRIFFLNFLTYFLYGIQVVVVGKLINEDFSLAKVSDDRSNLQVTTC